MSEINHVAIIMDGNGRWANQRLHSRIWGHIRGSSVVSDIVEEADNLNLKALTLYAFSTENWSRPKNEVSTLFKLLKKFLLKEKQKILANNINFKVIGEINELPQDTIQLVRDVEQASENATGLKLSFAFSYGGRAEIIRATNIFIKNNPGKEINESDFEKYLYRAELGDVDLMIRTGGDQRISNFLLWQAAYAELYFTPTKWPDFGVKEFRNIIDTVSNRERRFGQVHAQENLEESIKLASINKEKFIKESGSDV